MSRRRRWFLGIGVVAAAMLAVVGHAWYRAAEWRAWQKRYGTSSYRQVTPTLIGRVTARFGLKSILPTMLSERTMYESIVVEGLTDRDLAILVRHVPELRKLTLYEPQLGAEGSRVLGRLEYLKEVSVAPSRQAKWDYIWDSPVAPRPRLPGAAAVIAGVAGRRTLEKLEASDCGLTDEDLAPLSGMVGIRSLWLDGNRLTDEGLKHLSGLRAVSLLSLEGNSIRGPGLAQLASYQWLNLLLLRGTRLDDGGLKYMPVLPQLQYLKVSAQEPGASAGFAGMPPQPALEEITAGASLVTGDDLAAMANCPELRNLSVNGAGLTDEALAPLARMKALTDLDITDAGFTGTGLRFLPSDQPISLTLEGGNLTDAGMAGLEGKRFRRVTLTGLRIGREGLQHLARRKEGSGRLVLTGMKPIREAMAEQSSLRGIAGLEIGNCGVDDVALAGFDPETWPSWIRLWHNPITTAGVEALIKRHQTSGAERLWLRVDVEDYRALGTLKTRYPDYFDPNENEID